VPDADSLFNRYPRPRRQTETSGTEAGTWDFAMFRRGFCKPMRFAARQAYQHFILPGEHPVGVRLARRCHTRHLKLTGAPACAACGRLLGSSERQFTGNFQHENQE
jgi:hypothetical protein